MQLLFSFELHFCPNGKHLTTCKDKMDKTKTQRGQKILQNSVPTIYTTSPLEYFCQSLYIVPFMDTCVENHAIASFCKYDSNVAVSTR